MAFTREGARDTLLAPTGTMGCPGSGPRAGVSATHWADEVAEAVAATGRGAVVSTGISPSGDIHVGNLREIVTGTCQAFGLTFELEYDRGYPVTFNHAGQTDFVTSATKSAFGKEAIDTTVPPTMGSEDFSFMLEERPGAYIFMGNGESAGLHHPAYEFNDKAIPVGMTYWASLVEMAMPQRAA